MFKSSSQGLFGNSNNGGSIFQVKNEKGVATVFSQNNDEDEEDGQDDEGDEELQES